MTAPLPTWRRALDQGERCLALNPPADARALVEQFLADLTDASTPTTP